MISKIISDISDFIFVSDKPQKADAIFLPVAQLDRVPDSDSVGRRFESCWAGHDCSTIWNTPEKSLSYKGFSCF